MASSSEPPYLPIGTDVSAKYRGAFCEAKVKKIIKSVKCRVYLKETQSTLLVTDEFITGPLKVGATVEVKHPDTGRVMEATIKQMSDSSMYTVVFDDADERTLRRTQLCLKGDKHFMESETLDNLPLSNPEHFGTPVMAKGKRGRISAGAGDQEESDCSSEEDESPRKRYRGKNQELVSKIMFYESGDRKKPVTLPVLVVLPDAHTTELKNKDHVLVRSFKDGKFLSVSRKELTAFSRETILKNEDKALKPAMEKALLYTDNKELPPTWKREELLGSDDEDQGDEEDSSDDDEPSEEKDRFVAQLYKFSDDRGTPINKGPSIGTKDLNLHKLFIVVQKLGGYNRVTNQMKWRLVYSKMQLPPSNTASTQIKNSYKKYLHAFEDFYRKLGSSMGTVSRPSRSRNDSGRSLLSFRSRDAVRTPDKNDSDKEKVSEDTRSEFDSDADSVTKVGTPKRPKSARSKLTLTAETKELKEEKSSKDEHKQEQKKDEKETKKETTKKGDDSPKKTPKSVEEKREVKVEVCKKMFKKKEDGSMVPVTSKGKKEVDEELKDLQKKIGRRRSQRTDEKVEEEEEDGKKEKKDEQKEKIKDEQKEKKKEEKEIVEKKSVEKKPLVTVEKRPLVTEGDEKMEKKKKKKVKTETSDDEIEAVPSPSPSTGNVTDDLPVGARLKVRYGKGKNTTEYEAKIMEVSGEPGPRTYLVHYQGWNTRHDEWVGRERIMRVLDKPDSAKKKVAAQKPSPKPGVKGAKKKSSLDKPPASPSSVKSDSSTSMSVGPGRTSGKSIKPPLSSSPAAAAAPAKPRPTRSNSIELNTDGLPAKRRKRKTSSVYDSTNGSDSEESDKSDSESEVDKKPSKESLVESPIKSTSMPSIASEKPQEDLVELDPGIDRSPPKLSKVTDIGKEKLEIDEKPVESVEKSEVKEEPLAPVLKVANLDKSEPILQKIEAQLASVVSPEKIVEDVKEKVKEVVEKKEVKKKEPEKRGRKPAVKVDKTEKEAPEPEVNKKAEKVKENKETVNEKVEESPYDFKDEEPEIEKEIRMRERKKPVQVSVFKEDVKESAKAEPVKEETKTLKGSKDDFGKEDLLPKMSLFDEKDSAKSDSEVERRGRKKRTSTPKDSLKEIKNIKDIKTSVSVVVTSREKKLANNSSPERKPFVTLAEKKQGFSPMVCKVIPPPPEKCANDDSAKVETVTAEAPKEKSEIKEEVKKVPEMVVVHKASPVKTDIVLGRRVEPVDEEALTERKDNIDEVDDKDCEEVHTVKKKVRKKTKKKLEMEEQELMGVVRKAAKRGPGARKAREMGNSNKEESASANSVKDTSVDIDLHCEEEIGSRSGSPETVPGESPFIQESQGFVPRIETIDCRISDSQGSDSYSLKHDSADKSQSSSGNKSNMFENTPPTTPEHDSDDTSQQNSQNEQIKIASRKLSDEGNSRHDTSQTAGRESPNGNASPSNRSTGSSSGVIAGSEGSIDVPVYATNKRRRESDEPTPTKRRKRVSRGKSAASRARHLAESDSEDMCKGRSPSYTSDSYSRTPASANRSPRPPKFNFNLEEGQYLEGTKRISFLVDKITEIRTLYMNLKSEVACIDRRRKKLRRKEKEKDAHSSSAVEVEYS